MTLPSVRASAHSLALAVWISACAGGPTAGPAEGPTPTGDDAPAALVPTRTAPILLDDADPESLRTAVGRSLEWLDELPPDSLLDFGVREVAAGRLRASLEAFHAFLASDPVPVELAAWVRNRFEVVESVGDETGDVLFTGYYEPVIAGARRPTARATVPVYGRPTDLVTAHLPTFDPDLPARTLSGRVADARLVPYYTRRQIQEEGALDGRGLELAWVEDRTDLFFVQVQGSGAIRFPDGGELGISYAAANGRPYRSIGRLLIEDGLVPEERMSMQAIRGYLAENPGDVSRVLNHNASYVFFRSRETPPIGALGVPVTPERSIATDLGIFPRGALAFISTTRPAVDEDGRVIDGEPIRRFVLNQDTGGAIRGPGRVDLFWGRGDDAAETAGRMQQRGRLYFLVPRPGGGPGDADETAPSTPPALEEGSGEAAVRADDRVSFTIVSYNVHAGTDADSRPNLERVAAILDSLAADIVLLQEVDRGTARSGGVDQLAELRRLIGMHGVFGRSLYYDGGEYGIATLSRWPIRESRTVPLRADPPEERAGGSFEPRVALFARIDVPGGPLHVVNTHLGAGETGVYRRQELVALLAELHRATGRSGPLVVGGDLNATPESDVVAAATLALEDAFGRCGTGNEDTYPAHAPERRIDYLLLRALDCTEARVGASTASDHRPLVVELTLPGG